MPMGQMQNVTAHNRFKKKPLPFVSKRIDAAQNKKIEYLEKKILQQKLEEEVKWKDTIQDPLAITPVTVCQLLNPLSQGDTQITREGGKVQATSIQGRYIVTTDADNLQGNVCRIIIFWDSQANGTTPQFSDVLDTTTITSAAANTIYAPYNLNKVPRFKILYDKTLVLNPELDLTTAAGTVVSAVPRSSPMHKFKIPLKRIVNYGLGNAGDATDISTNSLWGLYLSDIPAASQPPSITIGTRFLFKDD